MTPVIIPPESAATETLDPPPPGSLDPISDTSLHEGNWPVLGVCLPYTVSAFHRLRRFKMWEQTARDLGSGVWIVITEETCICGRKEIAMHPSLHCKRRNSCAGRPGLLIVIDTPYDEGSVPEESTKQEIRINTTTKLAPVDMGRLAMTTRDRRACITGSVRRAVCWLG